jgi:hypothetical protein
MAKGINKSNSEPSEKVAPVESKKGLVKVKPFKQVNTSAFGHLYPGREYEISESLALALADLKEVEILS